MPMRPASAGAIYIVSKRSSYISTVRDAAELVIWRRPARQPPRTGRHDCSDPYRHRDTGCILAMAKVPPGSNDALTKSSGFKTIASKSRIAP